VVVLLVVVVVLLVVVVVVLVVVVRGRRAVVHRGAVVRGLRGRVAVHGVDRVPRFVVPRLVVAPVLLRVLRVGPTGQATAGQARQATAGQARQVRHVAGQARQAGDGQGRRVGERRTCRDTGSRECHGSDDTNAPDDCGNHG
jgi:hypothetical protein